jgi:HK97 gp10 family phage protein
MTVTWKGNQLSAGLRLAIMRGVIAGAELVRSEAVESIIRGKKSGRTYRRRGVTHVASAPGEPPAADTGTLHNSIKVTPNFTRLQAVVNAGASYAKALEYGTPRMDPRPFMRPALNNNLTAIEIAIATEARRFLGL